MQFDRQYFIDTRAVTDSHYLAKYKNLAICNSKMWIYIEILN